jgi:hypothetical protein
MDINLLTIHQDGSVEINLDRAGPPISGMDALFQRIVLKLLKSPGTDILNIGDGGGLQEMFLGSVESDQAMTAEISEIIRRTRESVLSDQMTQNLPDDERLHDLSIQNVYADKETGTLHLSLYFRNALQQSSTNTLVI